jgi:hypothetical protein
LETNTRDLAERRVTFGRDNSFQVELRRRVEEYFRSTGRPQRDCPQRYLKSALILTIFAGLYYLLVFVDAIWWQALPLALLLGLSMAAIGFNIEHDGGHLAYSNHGRVNRLSALTLDLIGASSYVWHWKHVVLHHTYVNITGHDSELARLGVRTVVNLREEDQRARSEGEEVRAEGLRHYNVGLGRTGWPPRDEVGRVLQIIDTPENQPVFIHCKRGADRLGLIIAIHRMRHVWTAGQAQEEASRYGMSRWLLVKKDYTSYN